MARPRFTCLALFVFCGGCAIAPPYKTTFDPVEVNWARSNGKGSISGIVRLSYGGAKSNCPGSEVTLTPRSARADEEALAFYGSLKGGTWIYGKAVGFNKNGDPRMAAYNRITQCDADNRYSFTDLPDGTYYLSAIALGTEAPKIIPGAVTFSTRSGVGVMRPVTIVNGAHVDIDLIKD
ncbi:hypothetical protein [Sphingomonas sp.]|uniref:hypothetical protein n=1 Tax=Sphingomonas sp. TaxID=28214 RepID=UPI0025D86868|nr:hypothetical protein [Sphingomonas sp.]